MKNLLMNFNRRQFPDPQFQMQRGAKSELVRFLALKKIKKYKIKFSDVLIFLPGILEYLLRHSESACSDVIAMGGLDSVIRECRSNDLKVLRHCAR